MHFDIRRASACFALCLLASLLAVAEEPAIDIVKGPTEPQGLQPFSPGDVFVGATLLNNPEDDHAGIGRIIQYDADLALKGVLMVDGTTHLVNGLTFAPDGTLWAFDLWAWITVRVTPEGEQLPNRQFAKRPLSAVYFRDDGTLLLTEALTGDSQPVPLTTKHPALPGEATKFGDGGIYHFDPDGEMLQSWAPDVDGGVTGSFAISHSIISADGGSLIYVSETGKRLMRYDFADGRQLPDIAAYPDEQREMYFDITAMSGARVLISMANRLDLVSENGDQLRSYPLAGFGWSVVAVSPDEAFGYVGNWFTGELAKVDLSDGEVAASTRVCIKCMADVAVYPVLAGVR